MKKFKQMMQQATGVLCLSALLFACSEKESDLGPLPEGMSNSADKRADASGIFYGLTDQNQLIKYNSGSQLRELANMRITGLNSGEKLLAIDFRPATGQLYGVSNQSRLYVINTSSGMAMAVGSGPFSPAINGDQVGFDFNPTVDRIRLVTDNEQNLRLNPETGTVAAIDGNLNPGDPTVVAVAYTNSVAGATTTTLYDLDLKSDMLFIQNPPNEGGLVPVGRLQVQAAGEGGFDIAPDNSMAIAALFSRGGGGNGNQPEVTNGNKYWFYDIDLKTGKAKRLGKTDYAIIGVAIPTNPVAYAVDGGNNLLLFNPYKAMSLETRSITGLQAGEKVLGIDMRPATGQLYALGSSNRIYSLNMANGAATAVGGPFSPALSGTSFGFDFNPTVDRIRVVSNTGQNLRLHPETGAVAAVDGMLNPGMPAVDASAYTNSFAGATTTTLYNIDYKTMLLSKQIPPNDGTQVPVGPLGLNLAQGNGFDIGGVSGKAYALLKADGKTGLYTIDLTTGRAMRISDFPKDAASFSVGLGF